MYFCESINYQLSDLKAASRHLLPLVKPLIHYSCSKIWIEEFRDFLIQRQQLFLEQNRRAKQEEISCSFHCDWPHDVSVLALRDNLHPFRLDQGGPARFLRPFHIQQHNQFYQQLSSPKPSYRSRAGANLQRL